MAKLSSIVICDGAVHSFGHWSLVGVTRTLWGDGLPLRAEFTVYLCFTDVRSADAAVIEFLDPVAAAAGETGAIKWRQEFALKDDPKQPTQQFVWQVTDVDLQRAVDHELHIFVARKLVDVVTIEVVA